MLRIGSGQQGRQARQPAFAVGIGQRNACGHLGNALGGMVGIALHQLPTQLLRNGLPRAGFAAARHAHDNQGNRGKGSRNGVLGHLDSAIQ
ncbi:hypothetical protein D3C71_1723290 [compost metagenome]